MLIVEKDDGCDAEYRVQSAGVPGSDAPVADGGAGGRVRGAAAKATSHHQGIGEEQGEGEEDRNQPRGVVRSA